MDICIEIENNQFFIQLFSKKDDFLSKMQYPIRIFFSKYESEILRAARTTSSKLVFERIKKKKLKEHVNKLEELKLSLIH